MNESSAFELLLPEGLLEFFELKSAKSDQTSYHLEIEEKNQVPEQYKNQKLLSKGFYEPIVIQDFPLRGKPCFLHVKRRRWTVEETGDIVCRDWNIVAKGTRLTEEFASFLKEINRY